ncbi:cyclophilin-like fold protein [Pedobacter sp. V48]|uniref:cyclophilin-like fold protein n=1 Tax=Pedobacter sp. V48 TaxID=509635 RepID=UPI0003E4D5B4|nr:cyclophilin-like fold protein [Pedobacter sp. V48]ETZ22326.1 hypothetical protein N824_25690 [Pedobacter sp. V48]
MKHSFLISALLMLVIRCSASSFDKSKSNINPDLVDTTKMANNKIKLTIGSRAFTVTIADNSARKAFEDMLPLTINMAELNGNEKYFDLPKSLPANSSNPGTIQNGDLMLYGSRTLVLFYKSFSTSYSYTRLGRVDNISGLAEALGSGSITVKYRLD